MSRRALGLFVAMSVIWGIPYLLIKVAVRDLGPAEVVFGRTAIGALALVPLAAARGELRPVLARWRPLVVYTVVELGVPWLLLSRAEQRLPSSLSGLLVAAVPLAGAVIALARPGSSRPGRSRPGKSRPGKPQLGKPQPGSSRPGRDRLGAGNLVGLVLGLLGVGVLLGFAVGAADAGSVALVGVVVVGYAAGPAILASRLGDLPPLGVAAASVGLCALAYSPWALTHLPASLPGQAAASVAVLGVVCTAVAFVAFFALIAEIGPVRATVITYLNPVVAVALGAAVLGEEVGWATLAGFAMILAGARLATRRPSATRRSELDVATP